MQEIRLDQLQRTHAAMFMWGSAPSPRACSGRRIQCKWAKNALNLRIYFLNGALNIHPSVSEAMRNLIMHNHESVGHPHAQLLLPHPGQPLPSTEHHPSSATPSRNPLVSSPRAQNILLSSGPPYAVLCEGGPKQWHLWIALNLVMSLPSKTEKHSSSIINAKAWQLDRVV